MPAKQSHGAQWGKCGTHACLPFRLGGICWCLHPHTQAACTSAYGMWMFYKVKRAGLKLLFSIWIVFIISCCSLMPSAMFPADLWWCWDLMRDCADLVASGLSCPTKAKILTSPEYETKKNYFNYFAVQLSVLMYICVDFQNTANVLFYSLYSFLALSAV